MISTNIICSITGMLKLIGFHQIKIFCTTKSFQKSLFNFDGAFTAAKQKFISIMILRYLRWRRLN